jgi:hypothetical protein
MFAVNRLSYTAFYEPVLLSLHVNGHYPHASCSSNTLAWCRSSVVNPSVKRV